MKTYEKPIIIENKDLAEGVFAASGSSCYTARAEIKQTPEVGRDNYCIQLNGEHNADHHCNGWQQAIITFNQNVNYVSSQGEIVGSSSGTQLTIQYYYHQNAHTNIGLGDLYVTSDPGLSITSFVITDAGHTMENMDSY